MAHAMHVLVVLCKKKEINLICSPIQENNNRTQPFATLTSLAQSICRPQPYAAGSQSPLLHREQELQM